MPQLSNIYLPSELILASGTKSVSKIGTRIAAVLFAFEGFFYIAYVLWGTFPSNLLFRSPPVVERGLAFAYAFSLAMFCVGIFFVCRAFILLFGGRKLLFSDYFASFFSIFLWAYLAIVSFLSASPANGMFLIAIGAINILSLICIGLSRSTGEQQEKEGGLFPISR